MTVNIVMKKTKTLNMIFIDIEREIAIMYMARDINLASPIETIPLGMGR